MQTLRQLMSCCPPLSLLLARGKTGGQDDADSYDDFVPLKRKHKNCADSAAAAAASNGSFSSEAGASSRKSASELPAAAAASYGATDTTRSTSEAAAAAAAKSDKPQAAAVAAAAAASQQQQQQLPISEQFPNKELGQLHFVLQYISAKSALYIRIIKGVGLTAQDSNGLSDPYVKMHLLPDSANRTKLRTKTCQRTLDPIWDEEFCYSGVSADDIENKMIRLSILDEDTIGYDWLGEILLPLKRLAHGKKDYLEIYLQPRNLELEKKLTARDTDRGKIQLGLYYAPAKSELTVKVMQCVNLIAMDPNGFSDPFVKLYLKPDKDKCSKFKTEVKKRTLNPEFNEEFVYHVPPQELPQKTLEITVWDKDLATKNDFIGALLLGNRCAGEQWSHWEMLMKQPYQRHDRWHSLMSELVLQQ